MRSWICLGMMAIACTTWADTNPKSWKLGVSIPITPKVTKENVKEIRQAGFDCLEVAYRLPPTKEEGAWIAAFRKNCEEVGLEIWSVHIPFSQKLDLSLTEGEGRAELMALVKQYLEWNSVLGAKVFVIHPSSEPIADADRPARMKQSIAALKELASLTKEYGVQLTVENLPRTCLGNTSEEMNTLVREAGPDLRMCFDANHLLQETPEGFLANLNHGIIYTTHISDYDHQDERHWVPYEGTTNWKKVVENLSANGFQGPFLYECRRRKDKSIVSWPEMVEIWKKILAE